MSGTAVFLMINMIILALEYKTNKEFREWFNSTVKAGIYMTEEKIYNAKLYKK